MFNMTLTRGEGPIKSSLSSSTEGKRPDSGFLTLADKLFTNDCFSVSFSTDVLDTSHILLNNLFHEDGVRHKNIFHLSLPALNYLPRQGHCWKLAGVGFM